MEVEANEGDFPHAPGDPLNEKILALGKWTFNLGGVVHDFKDVLKRFQAALKNLAALTTRMENHTPRGPRDYETSNLQPYVVYGGHIGPTKEPSWQNKVLSIVGSLLVAGILAIFGVLWAMNENVRDLRGDNRLVMQKQEAMEKHIEATDRDVAEIKRELWPHKH